MDEQDKDRALALYNEIFDEVGNENGMLQLLVSPTRQAVNLARAYDARDHLMQADDGAVPGYVQVIEDLRRQAEALAPAAPKAEAGQLSLFEEPEPADNVFDSLGFALPPDDAGSADSRKKTPELVSRFPDEDRTEETTSAPRPVVVPVEETSREETASKDVDRFTDAVEAFLSDFAIRDSALTGNTDKPSAEKSDEVKDSAEELPPQDEVKADDYAWTPTKEPVSPVRDEDAPLPETVPETAPKHLEATPAPAPVEAAVPQAEKPAIPDLPPRTENSPAFEPPVKTEKKPIVPLLILYIILAIPVTIAGIFLLLMPALLLLGLGLGILSLGLFGIGSAFTIFPVFADILMVFGIALVVTAFGLLVFWTFVWLLGGVIPGFVRGVVSLARTLCYKEVTV